MKNNYTIKALLEFIQELNVISFGELIDTVERFGEDRPFVDVSAVLQNEVFLKDYFRDLSASLTKEAVIVRYRSQILRELRAYSDFVDGTSDEAPELHYRVSQKVVELFELDTLAETKRKHRKGRNSPLYGFFKLLQEGADFVTSPIRSLTKSNFDVDESELEDEEPDDLPEFTLDDGWDDTDASSEANSCANNHCTNAYVYEDKYNCWCSISCVPCRESGKGCGHEACETKRPELSR